MPIYYNGEYIPFLHCSSSHHLSPQLLRHFSVEHRQYHTLPLVIRSPLQVNYEHIENYPSNLSGPKLTCKTCCREALSNFHEGWSMAATALNICPPLPQPAQSQSSQIQHFLATAKDKYFLLFKNSYVPLNFPKTETTHGKLWSKRRQEWKWVGNTNKTSATPDAPTHTWIIKKEKKGAGGDAVDKF